jgi:ferric-dicitrate binding protein FerR (iron transport regulator)
MPRPRSPVNVVGRIEQLLRERQEHQEALTRIDEMLERVGEALGTRPRGRPPGGNHSSVADAPARIRRRRRRKFAVSAAESVLAFVKQRKNPTTQEIKKHWTSEGRKGTADNALTLLVKDKKLKRTPLEGQRGSRYSLA